MESRAHQDLKHSVVAANPPLEFLDDCTPAELIALQQKYKETPEALEQLIKTGTNLYRFQIGRVLDGIAIWGANGLYFYYKARTASSGLLAGVNVYFPGTTVSTDAADTVGGIISTGTFTYILFSSAKKTAALRVIDNALRGKATTELDEFRVELGDHSEKSVANAFRYLANKLVFYTSNITSGLSGIYAFRTQLSGLPPLAKWPLSLAILYFMERFNSIYTDNYYKGLGFFLGKESKKYPYIARELFKKGKVSLPFLPIEAFIQLIGIVFLKPYPNYYLLNEFALGYFPGWPDSRLIAAITGLHTLSTYWPTSYKRLFGSAIEIYYRLLPTIDPQAPDVDKAVQIKKDEYNKKIPESKVLQQEPSVLLTTGVRALSGVYVGATVIAGAQSKLVQGIAGFGFGVLFGGILYLAESERVRNDLILELLKREDAKAEDAKDAKPTVKSFGLVEFGAGVIVFFNVASSTLGTAGSLALLGVTSPILMSGITLLALGSATVSATYSFKPVVETSHALVNSISRFFSRRSQVVPVTVSSEPPLDQDWVEEEDWKGTDATHAASVAPQAAAPVAALTASTSAASAAALTARSSVAMTALSKPASTGRLFDAKPDTKPAAPAAAPDEDEYVMVEPFSPK